MNFLRRRDPLALRFEQREGIFLPQVAGIWALHADVFFRAIAEAEEASIIDARLDWVASAARRAETLWSLRWDRVAIDGHFRYPVEPLDLVVGGSPGTEATFTFDAGLIRVPAEAPLGGSLLRLRLAIGGSTRTIERDLWRIEVESWNAPAASLTWLAPETR